MSKRPIRRIGLQFDNNDLAPILFGEQDEHLARIEEELDVEIAARGNELVITGAKDKLASTQIVFDILWDRLNKNMDVTMPDVDAAILVASSPMDDDSREMAKAALKETHVKTHHKQITPRTPKQAEYIEAIRKNDLVFGLGPAGTGKTFLAVAEAVNMMLKGEIDRLILSRPAVEAGERLGFLPGTAQEKVDPYLRPIYDALHELMPADQMARRLSDGTIEIAPLAFMRGRTLRNAFVILDEAQNTTSTQMKMALTRIGENSKIVATGDLSQKDLPHGEKSGLLDAVEVLKGTKHVGITEFTEVDVVRSRLAKHIVEAYEKRDKRS